MCSIIALKTEISRYKPDINNELSNFSITDDTEELDLIQAVAKQLHIQTSKEIQGLRDVLFPSIICALVHSGSSSIAKLEILKIKYGADLTMANYDGRTPLHIAASEGTFI